MTPRSALSIPSVSITGPDWDPGNHVPEGEWIEGRYYTQREINMRNTEI
jgi:hypothetical protein